MICLVWCDCVCMCVSGMCDCVWFMCDCVWSVWLRVVHVWLCVKCAIVCEMCDCMWNVWLCVLWRRIVCVCAVIYIYIYIYIPFMPTCCFSLIFISFIYICVCVLYVHGVWVYMKCVVYGMVWLCIILWCICYGVWYDLYVVVWCVVWCVMKSLCWPASWDYISLGIHKITCSDYPWILSLGLHALYTLHFTLCSLTSPCSSLTKSGTFHQFIFTHPCQIQTDNYPSFTLVQELSSSW